MELRAPDLGAYNGARVSFHKPVHVLNVWTPYEARMLRKELDALDSGSEATVFEKTGQSGYKAQDVRSCRVMNPPLALYQQIERHLLEAFRPQMRDELGAQRYQLHGGLQFLKYTVRPDGTRDHFRYHADGAIFANGRWNINTPDRHVTFCAYVNGDFEGGEFEFEHVYEGDKQLAVKPEGGLAVLFPSDPRFIHRVRPMISGTRYAIVGWLTLLP